MKEECLICKAPLVYLESDEEMECAICHKKENSKTRCVNGHYVCNECHMAGLDTIVGEGGLGISEGQAQRIAIARSLLTPGGIVLMDEPTSALDADTERLFLERLTARTDGKTIVIITHKKEIRKYVSEIISIDFLRE